MILKSFSPRWLFAGALMIVLPGLAAADEALPDTQGGRYSFTKQADGQGAGYWRLDSQTGAVALCSHKGAALACEVAPEDRALFENEIARLRNENAALKKELLSRGLPLPSGVAVEPDSTAPSVSSYLRLPSDADLDRAARFAGRVWHRFIDAVDRAQKQG